MTLHQETLAAEALKKVEPAADKRRPVEWKPAKAKPVGPMTYSVSKGADVFRPARQARKA